MKKEYQITMTFTVKSNTADLDTVSEYADQLIEDIQDNNELNFRDGIKITEIIIDNVEDNSYDDLQNDEED